MITKLSSGVEGHAGESRSVTSQSRGAFLDGCGEEPLCSHVRQATRSQDGIKPILLSFVILLSSCEVNHYVAHSSQERYVTEDSYTLGSANHTNRSDGSSRTFDGQKSFSDAMTAATTLAAGIGAVRIQNSQDGLKVSQDANAARIARDKIAAQKAVDLQNAANKAPIVTTPPQQVTIP